MSNLSDALNLNLNVVIRACAGAGKTYALTKRYLTILDSFAKSALRTRQNQWQGPPNILVITYTNKATDEMSGRIYQELHRIIYGKTTNDLNIGAGILQNPDYADWIIESFNRAQIMTIDALCNKIIRENPISAGVDPSFSVSDESQLKPIISGCLKSFLQKLSDEDDPRLNRLSTSISYHHLINVLNYLIAHEFDLLVSSNYSIPANPSAMVEQWRSDYEPKIPIEEIIHKCRTVLTQLIKLNPPHDQLENLKNVQHHIETIFQIKPEEQLSYYKENIHPFWVTKGGTYFRQTHYLIGNAKLWEQTYGKSHHRDDADALIKELLSYLNDVIPIEKLSLILTQNDFDCAESIMDLLSILKEFIPKLREIKLHENILSYQDVINLTHQVLTANPTIAERYGNQYAHIMVDEFQDTNDQRWEIIQKIASFGGKLRKSGIFLVGDEKQSIYRFQKADVKVMNFAEETLLNSDQPANIISFNDNYRSSSEFLHKAVNPIFSKLFRPPDEELKPYETGFIPTTYPENKPLQARDYDVNLGGSVWVDLLTVSKSDKTSFRENHLAYPRHVAKMIKEFQTTPQYQKCQVNPGEPKIGVLLRTIENNAPTFREAFQIEGLDFEIVSGRGLFSRQEVKDIEMLLALLLNPYDDVALIGILRSPLFSFDDNELTSLLAPDRQGLPVYKIVEESLPDVFSEIEGWRSESTSIPVDRLLEKIFRAPEREFGYLSEPDGDQRWKNILKCIRLIHQWSVNGDDKAEIHQKILDRIQHRYSGDMAPLSTSSEVVVMSIHKAKGLQFPFVVIADLHRKFNFSHSDVIFSGMLNTKFELGLTLSKVDGSEGSTVLAYLLKQQNKQENFAEYFRQLYVAVTRAKYGVIFSGVITELKRGLPEFKPHTEINSQFLDWIREIYGLTPERIAEGSGKHEFAEIRISDYNADNFTYLHSEPETIPFPKIEINPKFATPEIRRMSVHELSEMCSENHLHVSGESTEYLGAAFGTFIHWVIEHQFFDTQSNHHILEQKAASLGIDDSVISTQGWMAYIRNIANMDAITRLSELAENKKFNEHPMECELISPDGEIKIALSGVIDTLYEYDHSWVVRDYKTDTTDIRLSQYVLQVQIYLQMVKWLYQVEQVSGELVFTTQGKVIPVDFNPDFFSSLHILGKTGWTLSLPSVENLKLPNILNNPTESLIVISPTRFRISVLRQAMANQQWLRPDIIFDTMVSLNRRINSDTSPKSLVRLLLRKLLKNEYQGRSFSEFPGLLSSLTQAYEWFDKSGLEPNDNLGHTFQLVREALVQKGYYPYLSIEHANWDYIKGKHLVFDGWLPVTKKDMDFTELARKFADGVDILEAAEIEDIEVNHSWYNPFDTEDEIRFIASKIQQLLHAGTPIDEIVIVLPSMEKLVPRLAYIFKEKQIPFKLSKGEPVLERPVIQACMRLLSFFGRTKYKWTDLSAWFNHPLSWAAENYDQRDNFHRGLKQIDILFRRREKSKVALSPQFILQEISDYLRQYPNTEIETAWNFIRDQFQIWQSGTDPVHLVFNRYINRLIAVYSSSDEIEKSALNVFLSALDELNNLITGEHWMSSIQVYRLELAELLKNQDVPTPVQHDGISVLSVLDSLNNIDGKIVFVPGLSKADFPIVSSAGFLIPDIYDYHFHNHLKIFNYWLKTSKQLCLSCAGRDGDGNEQPHSLFLENLERIPVENPVKNPFSAASGKFISHDQSRSGLWDRQIRRHNAMVKNPFISSYFGKIKSDQIQNMLPYLSASQLSVLQETPLLFLMKYIWKIMETDPETITPLLAGNLIHQILDLFGKCNPDGWTLNCSDHNAACELLYKLSVTEMDHWSAQHFEVKYLMKPFLMGLTQDTENPGLFKRLLQEDLAYMKNFRFMASEQKFGNSESSDDNSFPPLVFHHPELGDLKIRGTIDRLDHVPGRCILGTDYKTGTIQSANDVSELNPQLQVYYLAVKANYPDSTVVMNYRQLKSLKDKKFGFTNHWLGDIDAETYLHELISRQKKLPFISETITKEITDNFLKILSPLVSGEFRLWTTAIPQKLVKYYYLEGPSRINSIRYVGGSDDNGNDENE